jgi:hypothetical protein
MEGAYKNDFKHLTSLSTLVFTFTIGFSLGILQVKWRKQCHGEENSFQSARNIPMLNARKHVKYKDTQGNVSSRGKRY